MTTSSKGLEWEEEDLTGVDRRMVETSIKGGQFKRAKGKAEGGKKEERRAEGDGKGEILGEPVRGAPKFPQGGY